MTRALDPASSPLGLFGSELRRLRLAVGWSQEKCGDEMGFSGDAVGKVETTERPPTPEFTKHADRVFSALFPPLEGHFARLRALARRWDGQYPQWFRSWLDAERAAVSLRWWEPIIMPGLLQTADYARELFRAWESGSSTDEELDELVSGRIERQAILDRPRPPELCVLLDEAVLYRRIGTHKTMRDQLDHVYGMSRRPSITVQVVPAEVGAHTGLLGAFIIAGFDGMPSILHAETAVEGQTIETPALVRKAGLAFDRLRAEALPRGASRDLIMKVADERWTT